ncbi:MAG: helix-turn-helix transcriptional regulator [Ruminococcaceae bacterium]|nr:helix-turn-helix transcriptional regulator [Oscillospiraceae bacterium]
MKVSYNKLWKLLVDKKMSKADLRKTAEIAPNTLTKMRKDEPVSIDVLLRICDKLDCNIGEMMDVIKDM